MNILIVNGNPKQESLCKSLSEEFARGARENNHQVTLLPLNELQFNPNLISGYTKESSLEKDLIKAQELINKAHHIVIVFPVWWGSAPAILKGFLDRTLLPGYGFKYRTNSSLWDRLLKGKTAHLLLTMDSPYWYYKWINGAVAEKQIGKLTLGFCGISPIKVTRFTNIRKCKQSAIVEYLRVAYNEGKKTI